MCGITGFISNNHLNKNSMQSIIENMTATLNHRGPDHTGFWYDIESQIAFGHKRLSILDLSSAGNQPMVASNEKFIIVFNGEIYNHLDLRKEIKDYANSKNIKLLWNGSSDTETLLTSIEIWGFEHTISKLVGMFSICFFDKDQRMMKLARDRIGEKPLYYGYVGNSFVFASELKAIKKFPNFDNQVNRDALKKYFKYMYIPCPDSIYKNIYKLEPGHILSISIEDINQLVPLQDNIKPYWSLIDSIKNNNEKNSTFDDKEYLNELEFHLQEAVDIQSIADVPLGAFLSGGIDSSIITALMQKNSSMPVKTFTVGFSESSFDESSYAKEVATHLRTDHSELFVSNSEARDIIPLLPHIYDEPFADSSQIPTYMVCKAASTKVKVALSGDAGDELFGGYNRYFWAPRLWNKVSWMPFKMRSFLGRALESIPASGLSMFESNFNNLLPAKKHAKNLSNKVEKLSKGLKNSYSIDDLYMSLISEWNDTSEIVLDEDENDGNIAIKHIDIFQDNFFNNKSLDMMFKDSLTYLPDDILCKVDRAAMSNSLETRIPFLDHRVVEYAWRMPFKMKIRNNKGKWALRQILYKYVPSDLIDRPKSGFAIPIGEWLRGPLKEWAEDLIEENKIIKQGFLNHKSVRKIWESHISGNADYTAKIWSILMFQSWLEHNS